MSYLVDMSDHAYDKLLRLPVECQRLVVAYIERLAESTSTMSRGVVSPPYPPGGMMSGFVIPDSNAIHSFNVFFRYSSDETRLIITSIGYSNLDPGNAS
jgi:hypothetical protein